MLFVGAFQGTVDKGKRIVLPKGLRRVLPPSARHSLFLIAGPRLEYLQLFPEETWRRRLAELEAEMGGSTETLVARLRPVLASAVSVDLDSRHRFLLPDNLREGAGIGSAVVLVGYGDSVLVFSRERWDLRLEERRAAMPDCLRPPEMPPSPESPQPLP